MKYLTSIELIAQKEGRETGRKEGKKEGKKEGRKEGKKEGRKEGKKEGRKEGKKEGRKEGKLLGQIELLEKFNSMKILAKDQYNQMITSLKSQLQEISQSNQKIQKACI